MKKKEKLKVILPLDSKIMNRAAVLSISPISPPCYYSNPNLAAKELWQCTHVMVSQYVNGQTVWFIGSCTNDAKGSGGGGTLAAPTYY